MSSFKLNWIIYDLSMQLLVNKYASEIKTNVMLENNPSICVTSVDIYPMGFEHPEKM